MFKIRYNSFKPFNHFVPLNRRAAFTSLLEV